MEFSTDKSISQKAGINNARLLGTAETTQTVASAEQLSELVSVLYSAAMDSEGWTAFLEALRLQLRGNYASLIVRDAHGDNLGWVISATGGLNDVIQYDPYAHWSPFRGLVKDKAIRLSDLMAPAAWLASPYYTDWCKEVNVFHILATDIGTDNGCSYGLRVTRPEQSPDFGEPELGLIRMLLPHLKRALNMHLALNHDRQLISLYGKTTAQLMMGVVILDQNGSVIESNPAATSILNSGDGIRVKDRALEAVYANDNRKLQRLIRGALMHAQDARLPLIEGMSISRQSGEFNWGVVIQSVSSDDWTEGKQRPCVAVFLRDTTGKAQPPVKLAQQLFQLTPAETAVAIQLTNGLSLEEAADSLNIRLNTARAHLRSIFSKTGVRRQTELVRLFLNSVAWLGNK